jgi:GH25 family lysozyme M1 (1,4-beta-N-acetylmuramidase)
MRRRFLTRAVTAAALVLAGATPLVMGNAPHAAAARKVFDGPDVASYQHPRGKPIHWKKVASSGKEFAIIKASEGTTYRNPNFAGPTYDDYADAAAAGLVHGAYHFARPGFPIVGSAQSQAKFFANVVGPVRTEATLPPALDLEVTGGLNPAQLVTWAEAFELEMRQLTGRTPMIYTYPNFWENSLGDPKAFARYPLWMAAYGTSTAPTADLWQYTSTAKVPGIIGNTDVSKFVGTSGLPWSTLSNGTVHTRWKDSAPGAPNSVVATIDDATATIGWKPGDAGTSRITSYVVKALANGVPVSAADGGTATVSGTTFAASFDNLTPGTEYTFTVSAANAIGKGVASAASNPVTPTIPTTLKAAVPTSLSYGEVLAMTAKLTRADTKAALAGRTVLLFRRHLATGKWKQIRRLSTDTKGRASVDLTPHKSAHLEAVFPGAKGVERSTLYKSYVVHPTVTASLSHEQASVGDTVVISGTVAPYLAGQKVTRQRLLNGRWVAKDTTTVSDNGEYSFTIVPKVAASYAFRDIVAAGNGRGSGISPKLRLTVS